MDDDRFDAWSRRLPARPRRRGVLAILAALGAALPLDRLEAKKRKKRGAGGCLDVGAPCFVGGTFLLCCGNLGCFPPEGAPEGG